MRYRINKKFNFEYGHRLSKHKGNCFSLHGHSGLVEVQLESETLDINDMVIDFSVLKEIVNSIVISIYDHSLLLNSNDNIDAASKLSEKIIAIQDEDPTSEVMARTIFFNLQRELKKYKRTFSEDILKSGLDLSMYLDLVTFWETDTSSASYGY